MNELSKKMDTSILNIKTNHPAIRIKLGEEMSINKKVLHALGDPENIHFWWSDSQRVLLISDATQKTLLSFKINERYYNTKTGFKIGNLKFMQTIMNITGWSHDMIYTVTGEFISAVNMVAFKISDADEMKIESGSEADADV